eukprot:scaffold107_cov106-Isochrysis_galbana.AAC.16
MPPPAPPPPSALHVRKSGRSHGSPRARWSASRADCDDGSEASSPARSANVTVSGTAMASGWTTMAVGATPSPIMPPSASACLASSSRTECNAKHNGESRRHCTSTSSCSQPPTPPDVLALALRGSSESERAEPPAGRESSSSARA